MSFRVRNGSDYAETWTSVSPCLGVDLLLDERGHVHDDVGGERQAAVAAALRGQRPGHLATAHQGRGTCSRDERDRGWLNTQAQNEFNLR